MRAAEYTEEFREQKSNVWRLPRCWILKAVDIISGHMSQPEAEVSRAYRVEELRPRS